MSTTTEVSKPQDSKQPVVKVCRRLAATDSKQTNQVPHNFKIIPAAGPDGNIKIRPKPHNPIGMCNKEVVLIKNANRLTSVPSGLIGTNVGLIRNQTMVNSSFQITNVNNSLTLSYINSGLPASNVNGVLPLSNVSTGLPVNNVNGGLSLSSINDGLPLNNINSGLLLGNVGNSACNSPCKIKEDPGIDSVTQLLIPVRDPLSNEIKDTLIPMETVDDSVQYTAKNILTPIAGNDGNLTYDVKKVGLPVHLEASPLARLENTVVWNNSATTQTGDKRIVSHTRVQKQSHEKKKEDTQLFIILTGSQMKQLASIQTGDGTTEIGRAASVASSQLDGSVWNKNQGVQMENKPKIDTEEKGTETTELEMEQEKETEIQWGNPPPQYVRSVCPVCQKVFKTRRLMGRHLRSIHKKTLSCDKCNKRYSTRQSLLTHQRSHEDDYYLECPICHLRYKREAGLKNHQIRVHSNVEPKYMCDYCGKRYKLKFDLSKHIERIHPSSSHICKSCGKIVKDIGHHEWVHERAAKKAATLRYRCHLCSKRFSTRNNLDNHLLLHKDGFKCNLCGETCKSQTSLSYHKERKHKPTARCSICQKSFSRTSFYQHVLTHAGIRPYKCDVCGEDFTQRSSVLRHRKTHPGPLPPYTESTPIANIAKQILEKLSEEPVARQQRNPDRNSPYHLTVVDSRKLENNETLKKRSKQTPTEDPTEESPERDSIDLDNDSETLPSTRRQTNKSKVKTPTTLFKKESEPATPKKDDVEVDQVLEKIRNTCPFCEKRFDNARKVENHVTYVHRKPYKCDMCKRACHTARALEEHKLIHRPDYFFECEICHVKYKSEDSLKRHNLRTHSDYESKYVCEHCGRSYKLKIDLTHHMKRTHVSELQVCRFCGKEVKDVKGHEWRHQKRNKEVKYEHTCHLCRKKFHHRSRLDNHLRLHEKGFKCEECGKEYRGTRELMSHKRFKHGQAKISTCILCQKEFPSSSNFYQHVLTHAGIRPYKCDVCEEDFTQRSSLLRHRRHHPGPLPPLRSTHPQIAELARSYLQKLQSDQIDKSYVLNARL